MARRLPFSAKLTILFVLVLLHEICSAKPHHHCAPSSCSDIRNISYPFRLKDDPKNCGIPRYTLRCENNHTLLYLYGEKYYVRKTNYNNHTIRVLDSGFQTDSYSLDTRYFLNQQNFSYGNEYYDAYTTFGPRENGLGSDFGLSKGVVFWICEKPVNSPLYYDIPTSFDDGGNSSNSFFSHSKKYRYVGVRKMNVSEVQDFCQVEGMFLTSWPGNEGPNISCSDFRDELQYGFELSWSGVSCDSCNQVCYFDKGNRYRCGLLMIDYLVDSSAYVLSSLNIIGMYHGLLMILGTPLIIAFLIYKWHRRHQSM